MDTCFCTMNLQSGMRVLEALSATGLRSIRYAKEVPGIKHIIANDLSSSAVKSIEKNIQLNNVESLITASEANATTLMYNSTSLQTRFDVIDLGIFISMMNIILYSLTVFSIQNIQNIFRSIWQSVNFLGWCCAKHLGGRFIAGYSN